MVSLAEVGEVTLGVAGVGAAESVSRVDVANGFLLVLLLNKSLWVGLHGPLLFR